MKTKVVRALYGTGSCFEDIGVIWRIKLQPLIEKGENLHETVRIVHGIIPQKGSEDKKPYSHAWVEHRNDVMDCRLTDEGEKIIVVWAKRDYYRARKITDFTAYTCREFAFIQLKHGHCGPFLNRYHALTKDAHLRKPPEGPKEEAMPDVKCLPALFRQG